MRTIFLVNFIEMAKVNYQTAREESRKIDNRYRFLQFSAFLSIHDRFHSRRTSQRTIHKLPRRLQTKEINYTPVRCKSYTCISLIFRNTDSICLSKPPCSLRKGANLLCVSIFLYQVSCYELALQREKLDKLVFSVKCIWFGT